MYWLSHTQVINISQTSFGHFQALVEPHVTLNPLLYGHSVCQPPVCGSVITGPNIG